MSSPLSSFPARVAIATALALAGVMLAGALPEDAAAKTPSCAKAGRTIVKTKTARIYEQTVRISHDEKEPRTYGCWLPTGDRLRLDQRCDPEVGSPQADDACFDTPGLVAVNGRYVALTYGSLYFGEYSSQSIVVWARLRKPARQNVVRIESHDDDNLGPDFDRLFVSKRGAIAYSASGTDDFDDQGGSVVGHVAPVRPGSDADDTTLDHGTLLDSKSLRIDGSTLTWTNDGVTKTSPWE
jgi:hypothetical protein